MSYSKFQLQSTLFCCTQDLEATGHIQIELWNYFVGRKGLYVPTNNPNQEDFDVNYLRYDIILFEGLEYED